jgi:hypothetical protein
MGKEKTPHSGYLRHGQACSISNPEARVWLAVYVTCFAEYCILFNHFYGHESLSRCDGSHAFNPTVLLPHERREHRTPSWQSLVDEQARGGN